MPLCQGLAPRWLVQPSSRDFFLSSHWFSLLKISSNKIFLVPTAFDWSSKPLMPKSSTGSEIFLLWIWNIFRDLNYFLALPVTSHPLHHRPFIPLMSCNFQHSSTLITQSSCGISSRRVWAESLLRDSLIETFIVCCLLVHFVRRSSVIKQIRNL